MKNISIIIPIHNRLPLTQKGLKSLSKAVDHYKQTSEAGFNISIVVVDDGSLDGSSDWIRKNYAEIHLLRGDGNLWWTGSVNKGSQYAVERLKADSVILWNDDTLCDINYFIELERLYKQNTASQNSILASKVYWLNEGNKLFNYGCYYSFKTGKKKVIGLNEPDSEKFNKIIPIDWSGGMGTIIPADTLRTLNYFDAISFPQYHADIDFFLRANKKGYSAFAIPTLKIYNNRESTGLSKTRNVEDVKNLFFSNRSNYNFRHNYNFNLRHANTAVSWANFSMRYMTLLLQSIRTIAWS